MAMAAPVGIILSGGLGRRMGGADKGLITLHGESLVSATAARLRPQVAGLAINANGDTSRFADLGYPVLPDDLAGHPGPLAGILAGLDWAASLGRQSIVTVAVDTPFFPRDLVERLQAASGQKGVALAASFRDGMPDPQRHPTFGLWPVSLRQDLRTALDAGIRKVAEWADKHDAGTAVFSGYATDPFFNINTPQDLALAEEMERLR